MSNRYQGTSRRTVSLFTILILISVLIPRIGWSDSRAARSYPELGVLVTGIVQPSIGYWWGQTGMRVSGMYWDDAHHELHLNLGYSFRDTGKAQHSINILTSRVTGRDPGTDYDYAATGLAYSLNYRGFFVELGIARPWKDWEGNLANDPFIPSGYWGYIYRF